MTAGNNYPLEQVAEGADALIAECAKRGVAAQVFQKFTCINCGARQTMDVPNTFFTSGTCEECGAETDIAIAGCNYMVLASKADKS